MFLSPKYFLRKLVDSEARNLPFWRRCVVRFLQMIYATFRDLSDGQLSLQAMSLVYTTLITLVPLLAISFSVLKGFGVHNQIEPLLMSVLEGLGPAKSQEVAAQVIQFVDNIKFGVLGAVGLGLLIYAVIALMQKIEAAFNYIWRVGQERTLSQRFSDYLSVLLMGPLLIFISAGLTTAVRHSPIVQGIETQNWFLLLYEVSSFFLPWVVMAIGFTFIYVYMPNTKVRIGPAFCGGMVASLLWKLMGYVFSSFIINSPNYIEIYAAFATLIVLMIWLYASWLVVLIGSNISFYMQYPRYLRVNRLALVLTPYMKLKLGLSVLSLIVKHHYEGGVPWGVDTLSKALNVPLVAVQKVLNSLERGGIVIAQQKEPIVYYPAVPFDQTPLKRAIDALQKEGHQGWVPNEHQNFTAEAKAVMDAMENALSETLSSESISKVLGPK